MAFFFLLDNDLISSNQEINSYFDFLINEISLDKEIKNLTIYKKGLFNSDFVDENQLLRYKLTTLPKETAKLPILEVPNAQLTFNGAGQVQTISPNTRNGVDKSFTFVLQNSDLANILQWSR